MATVTRRIEVCDVCRDVAKPIEERARIAVGDGRLRTYAFCKSDFMPLTRVLTAIAQAAPEPAGRRGGSKQVTMEDIETVKAQRGRPRKTAAAKKAS
jgi:hypothetical protein